MFDIFYDFKEPYEIVTGPESDVESESDSEEELNGRSRDDALDSPSQLGNILEIKKHFCSLLAF